MYKDGVKRTSGKTQQNEVHNESEYYWLTLVFEMLISFTLNSLSLSKRA